MHHPRDIRILDGNIMFDCELRSHHHLSDTVSRDAESVARKDLSTIDPRDTTCITRSW
jgi:hypothetical protein